MRQDYCVIMAGGIGSRFWPVSRSNMPKQFLDIMGTGRTLIQQTYDRLSRLIPADNIFVVTNEEYRKIVQIQLPLIPNSNILGEPMRRNTAPCILYANIRIGLRNPKANIIVTPADHLIVDEEEFLKNISEGLEFVNDNDSLLTFGITPDRPATGYGYIQMNRDIENSRFVPVKTFTEKPHLELAKFFLSSGDFLWNSGIFLWKHDVIDKEIHTYLPEMYNLFMENKAVFGTQQERSVINRIYSDAKSMSIDFGVMEKAQNVCVLKTDFGWSDLGTWNSLYSLHDKDVDNNVIIGNKVLTSQSFNNYINISDSKKVLIINGVEDLIVVDTETALLICRRENEQQISDLLNEAKLKYGDGIK